MVVTAAHGAEKFSAFGDAYPNQGWLRGSVYYWPTEPPSSPDGLHNCAARLPDFSRVTPAAMLYTPSLNVRLHAFTEGFGRDFPALSNWFGIVYRGDFWIEKPGEYGFRLSSTDGSKLYIDDVPVVNNDCIHPMEKAAAVAVLSRGMHRLEVAYFKGPGELVALVMEVARPGGDYRPFDVTEFEPPPGALDFAEADYDRMRTAALAQLFGAPPAAAEHEVQPPDDPRDRARKLFEQGVRAAEGNNSAEALRLFQEATAAHPAYAQAWREMGRLQAAGNRLNDARASFESALKADPKDLECHLLLAGIEQRAGNWAAVIDRTERLTRLDSSGFPGAYLLNAIGHFQTGNLSAAEESARTAEKLDLRQQYPEIRDLLGRILLSRGGAAAGDEQLRLYAAAAGEFRAYLAIAPSGPRAEDVRTVMSQLEALLPVIPPPAVQASAFSTSPSEDEQARFLAAARSVAIDYARLLPNFLCSETVRRFQGKAREPLDTLAVEVRFFDGKDEYRLAQVNGVAPEHPYEYTLGLITTGEFGSQMRKIFDPDSATVFRFERWATLRQREAAVYSYRMEPGKAHYKVIAWKDGKLVQQLAGLRGEVVIDRQTFGVLRLSYAADSLPPGFPVQVANVTVDYDHSEIAGRRYLLPLQAVAQVVNQGVSQRNEVSFHSYRKFSSDSNVRFEDGVRNPQP